ncbi:hypothetical protein F7725_029212, partial [Dissostichus mawsoni]
MQALQSSGELVVMGGASCREQVREELRRGGGGEENLMSADRIRKITVRQFGFTVLSLARRGLKEPPDELWELLELQKLNLSLNSLKSLPAPLAQLRNLESDPTQEAEPESEPDVTAAGAVYSMKALVFLHLAGNRLENLAENLQSLTELKILIVEGNNLHSLPKALCCLNRLELLNLDFNDIKDLPQELHQLCRLERLACHPLDKGLHIVHNPLIKPVKE